MQFAFRYGNAESQRSINPLRAAAAAALVAAMLAGVPASAPAQATAGAADAQYVALAQAYYDSVFKLNPLEATGFGVHTYDARLGDFSAAGVAAQDALDNATWTKLQAIDRTALSPSVALDARLLGDTIQDDLLNNDALATWKHNPDYYVQIASGAIFTVMSKAYAPLPIRLGYAIARERQLPAMLQRSKLDITSVDAVTQRVAAEDAAGAVDFFKESVPEAFFAVKDLKLQNQFATSNAAAMKAMVAYAAWIKTIKPKGTFAIGADAYRKKLKYEDGLDDMSLDQYLKYGQAELDRLRAQFAATAKIVNPKKTPLEVYLSITRIHPAPNALLAKAKSDLIKLRAFLIAKHIITLPRADNIKVVETPAFLRATTSAEEDSPGPLETVATQAYYNVTPVDPNWTPAQKEEFLEQFNDFEFSGITAHEVYPGHFTNFAIDRELPLSLTRKLSINNEFGEGWAHYSEQMVVDQGWGNGDPRVRLGQLEEALLRACRYVVGVKLHTAGMTLEQAEKTFTGECYLPAQVGIEESLRGTQDPMYGYYTLGKLMILKLREDYKKKLGAAYTLQKFHDELLSRGDPPLPYLRPFMLGPDDDGKPL